eukprot:8850967-Alexandrium_andersonii.AAC.1
MVAWTARAEAPLHLDGPEALRRFCHRLLNTWASRLTCRERRKARLPTLVRSMLAKAATSSD